MLNSFVKTHIGQRSVNEDSYLIDEDLGLYIVADGVGGLEKGEVASKLACQTVLDSVKSGLSLADSVYKAHRSIISEMKLDPDKQGMATTIVAILFDENYYNIAWVGDSRVYIWDNGELRLITKDDSYVELLLENGHISVDELETHPDRNVISQALGVERKQITINSNSGILKNNQILLACSDGLYSIATELYIIKSIKNFDSLEDITTSLVDTAVKLDGKDNITLISIKCSDCNNDKQDTLNPDVYREYNKDTGKILGTTQTNKIRDFLGSEEDVSPDLVDQTELKDLSQEEHDLIENASKKNITIKNEETDNNSFPLILIGILIIIALVVTKLF